MIAGDVVVGLRGSYRIVAQHGAGAFGITYRARTLGSEAPVIVKELRLEKLGDWKALELFEREGHVLATLSHPNIPAFCDFFAHGGGTALPVATLASYTGPEQLSLVLVQELIEGSTLQQRVDARERLSVDEAETLLVALLKALRYLHERTPPLIHRDIKPSNIVVTPDGRPYLVDFGAIQDRVRAAGSVGSTIVGTLGYMALEQTRGDARPASDLYALGVTLLVALAGRPLEDIPVDDATGKLSLRDALPPHTPDALRDALDSMIAPLLGQRAHSAAEVLARLAPRPALVEHVVPERPASGGASRWSWNAALLPVGGLVAVVSVASSVRSFVKDNPRLFHPEPPIVAPHPKPLPKTLPVASAPAKMSVATTPPADVASGPVTLRWTGRLDTSSGSAPPVGTACTLTAEITANAGKAEEGRTTFECQGKMLYDSAVPLNGMSNSSFGLTETVASDDFLGFTYELSESDTGSRSPPRAQISVDTHNGELDAWRDTTSPFRVHAKMEHASALRRGKAVLADTAPTFNAVVFRRAKVISKTEKPPFTVPSCGLRIGGDPPDEIQLPRLARVRGPSHLRRRDRGGFNVCSLVGGADGAPTGIVDPNPTPVDKDPAFTIDLPGATATLSDTSDKGVSYSVTFALEDNLYDGGKP